MRAMVRDFLDRVFGGSAEPLALPTWLEDRRLDPGPVREAGPGGCARATGHRARRSWPPLAAWWLQFAGLGPHGGRCWSGPRRLAAPAPWPPSGQRSCWRRVALPMVSASWPGGGRAGHRHGHRRGRLRAGGRAPLVPARGGPPRPAVRRGGPARGPPAAERRPAPALGGHGPALRGRHARDGEWPRFRERAPRSACAPRWTRPPLSGGVVPWSSCRVGFPDEPPERQRHALLHELGRTCAAATGPVRWGKSCWRRSSGSTRPCDGWSG